MAYCTRADIEALVSAETLRQLTDDEQAGDVDDSIVDACIASADASIDGYLRGRYTVPLATVPVPQLVLDISRDIAVYNLFSRKGEGGVPEIFSSRKNDARKQLKDGGDFGPRSGHTRRAVGGVDCGRQNRRRPGFFADRFAGLLSPAGRGGAT
jgi:phage gp36-like protein